MKFGAIEYLPIFILPVIVGIFLLYSVRKRKELILRFVSNQLLERLIKEVSFTKKNLKLVFVFLAIVFSSIALIRPKWGFHWEEVNRKGVDIVIALDVSKSMLATDVSPNRLERAKREVIDLLNILKGDRVGLVAFAGGAFLQSPLTLDYGAVSLFLEDLDTTLIPIPGTAVAEAIDKGVESFSKEDKKSRVLILITDGEDHEGNPIESAIKAKSEKVTIYTIGIGKEGGAPIPSGNNGGFIKDRSGELVLTKLDEQTLQKIALETSGSYVRSITGDLDLEEIYKDIQSKIQDKDLKSGRRKRFEERFQWPLSIALVFFLLFVFLPEKKRKDKKDVSHIVFKSLVILFLVSISHKSHAFIFESDTKKGSEFYKKKEYQKAFDEFTKSQMNGDLTNEEILKYNTANSLYKLGEYDKAQVLFEELAVNGDKEMSQKSFYNLGNNYFKQGKLQEAIKSYERSLEIEPNDEDVQYNLEFVREELKRRLEDMKNQQQNQDQNQSQDGQESDQQNDQQDQEKQDQNQEGKDQNKGDQQDSENQDDENQEKKDQGEQSDQQDQEGKQKDQEKDSEKKEDEEKSGNTDEEKEKENEAQANKSEEEQKEENQQNEDGSTGNSSNAIKDGKEMSEEEAEKWFSELSEDRKKYLDKKMKGARRYRSTKDW